MRSNAAVAEEYRRHLAENGKYSFLTIGRYMDVVKRFVLFLNLKSRSILVSQRSDVWEFLNHAKKHGVADANVYEYQQIIVRFFDFLIREFYLEKNPAKGIVKKREHKKASRILTFAEVQRILKELESGHHHFRLVELVIFRVLYYSAVTVRELLDLRMEDINIEKRFITVTHVFEGNISRRLIWLSKDMCLLLTNYVAERAKGPKNSRYLFPAINGNRIYRTQIYYLIRRICTSFGVVKIGPKILRKTAISHLKVKGARIETINYLAGRTRIEKRSNFRDLGVVKKDFLKAQGLLVVR